MNRLHRTYIAERLVYIVIWLFVFLTPVLIAYWPIHSESGIVPERSVVLHVWGVAILPFFLLFCLNNFWLAPGYLLRKRYLLYATLLIMLFGLFVWVDSIYIRKEMNRVRMEGYKRMMERSHAPWPGTPRQHRPLPPASPPELAFTSFISRFLIAFLMIGFNIAIKMIFKSLRDEEAMTELERRKLQTELESLKYQINPHFFMNTLNNIHALVDVNRRQAQKAIVEFSKMMRYVLYEADRHTILLEREVQFLKNYIELMKLRYIDKVNVEVSLPAEVPLVEIPPLLYISFVENAFKHGVSYRKESAIYVAMQVADSNLIFTCSNTNNGRNREQHSGVGLENIRKRLRLLYDRNYTLAINDASDCFNVLLIIPL